MPSQQLPDYDDLPVRAGLRCAWNVWAPDGGDRFGCLNLLTPEQRRSRPRDWSTRGAVFPLNWSMALPDPPLFGRGGLHPHRDGPRGQRRATTTCSTGGTRSRRANGTASATSSIPALRDDEPGTGHFGGVDDGDHGIDHWARRGIVTRGVLADVGRWREAQGRPIQYDEPDAVMPDELRACLADQGSDGRRG